MTSLKNGVSLKDLQPQMVLAALVVMDYFRSKGIPNMVITSCNDSTHMKGSLHYEGKAIDFRTHDITLSNRAAWLTGTFLKDIKDALGAEFDCIVEDISGPNEHLHIEYQPKPVGQKLPS